MANHPTQIKEHQAKLGIWRPIDGEDDIDRLPKIREDDRIPIEGITGWSQLLLKSPMDMSYGKGVISRGWNKFLKSEEIKKSRALDS